MGAKAPHPNVVLFDARVGFHCRAKLGIVLGENWIVLGENPGTENPGKTRGQTGRFLFHHNHP
jgi:hypothetical protein